MVQFKVIDLDHWAIFKAWEGREDEWLSFSEILRIARSRNEKIQGKSGKVRFIRKMNRLVKVKSMIKAVREDRSTWYKPAETFDVAISSVAERLRDFSKMDLEKVGFVGPGRSSEVSEERRWMVAGIVDSTKKILLRMLGLPPEANLYIGVFKQRDEGFILSIKQPSEKQQKRLRLR